MNGFPAFLQLARQPVLLVGGGDAAVAKARLLLAAGADLTVAAAAPTPTILDWARDGVLKLHRRPAAFRDIGQGAWAIVVVAEPDTDGLSAAAAARAVRVPVNVVDRPELSTFIMPAIIDRDPVLIAVSTGGASPALARRVRAWIETVLPSRLGQLARALAAARPAVNQVLESADSRRRFWDSVLDGPITTRILRGDDGDGCPQILARLDARDRGPNRGVVHVVGADPGDPDLLTLKALRLLQQADLVVHDPRIDAAVTDRARRDAVRIAAGPDRTAIDALLLHHAGEGHRVVFLLTGAGDIADATRRLRGHGHEVEAVPGVAAIALDTPAAVPTRALAAAS